MLTAADIPGTNDCGPIVHDDPILADGEVRYLGQPVFAVIADDARRRAPRRRAGAGTCWRSSRCRRMLTPREAHAAQPVRAAADAPACAATARRPRSRARRTGSRARSSVGGQEQFYLEGQICYAIPTEDDGMHVHCSTQHPSEMQHLVAHALRRCSRTTCRSSAGAWAAASAARNRSRRCSRASPRSPRASSKRPGQAARSTATTTSWSPAGATASTTTTRSASTTTAASSARDIDDGLARRLLGRPVRAR